MAITPADLLAPAGPVEDELFPGEGDGADPSALYTRLLSYVTQAVAKTSGIAFPDEDAAVEAWALHLTFKAAYMVAVARPATENSMVPVLGSETYTKDQRDALRAKADEYESVYAGLLAAIPAEGEQPVGVPTRTVSLEFDY